MVTDLRPVRWSHSYVEVVIEDAFDVGLVCPVEQQHLLRPILEVFEPIFALLEPLTGDVVFNVLDALDGVLRIQQGPGGLGSSGGGHLVEETGGDILVNCSALVGVAVLLGVKWEYSTLSLPAN